MVKSKLGRKKSEEAGCKKEKKKTGKWPEQQVNEKSGGGSDLVHS